MLDIKLNVKVDSKFYKCKFHTARLLPYVEHRHLSSKKKMMRTKTNIKHRNDAPSPCERFLNILRRCSLIIYYYYLHSCTPFIIIYAVRIPILFSISRSYHFHISRIYTTFFRTFGSRNACSAKKREIIANQIFGRIVYVK